MVTCCVCGNVVGCGAEKNKRRVTNTTGNKT